MHHRRSPRCSSLSPAPFSLVPAFPFLAATMPRRPRSSSGFHSVYACPSAVFYAEICFRDIRLELDTFDTTEVAACAYDAAAWRLSRPRSQMNFMSVWTCEEVQTLTPPPRVIIAEDRCIQVRRDRHLLITATDEQAMKVWCQCFPQDVLDEHEFLARQRTVRAVERAERRERKAVVVVQCDLGQALTWSSDDDRSHDAFLTSNYTIEESEEE
ncbi:t-complex protein 1 subunit eta [Hordeum vulgare]|nr:t-complex protein 1 subunit eta [Hordeum vulgare]